MNKLIKTTMVGLGAVAMIVSSTASASATRSANALPRTSATKVVKRTAAPAVGAQSNEIGTLGLLLGLLGGGAAVAGFVTAVQSDSKG